MLLSSQKGYTRFLSGASDYVWDSVFYSSGGSYWLIHWWMVLYTLIRQLLLALFLWGASDYVWDSVYCSSGGSYWLIHWRTVLPSSDSCYWHCFLFSSLVIGLTVLVNQNHQEEYNQSRPLGIPFFFHSYRAIRHIIYS